MQADSFNFRLIKKTNDTFRRIEQLGKYSLSKFFHEIFAEIDVEVAVQVTYDIYKTVQLIERNFRILNSLHDKFEPFLMTKSISIAQQIEVVYFSLAGHAKCPWTFFYYVVRIVNRLLFSSVNKR